MKYEPEHDPWHQMHNNRLKTTIDYPDYVPTRIPQDDFIIKPCKSPSHNVPPMMYFPPGREYIHTCPHCGETQTVFREAYYCARSVN